MEITPEIKAQLNEQKKQCIFCKIITGEMQGKKVFEDDKTLAILDIYPAKKGHTVLMLKEHYPIMPYIPAIEFKHYFGLVPALGKAISDAMVSTGVNVFIANGGAAGQQSPHFLIHLLPRDSGDGFFNFMFDKRSANLESEKVQMLANNFPIMMQNHFGRNPASWHSGKGDVPGFLTKTYESSFVIYEDEKVLCIVPKKSVVAGHIEIYSKVEELDVGKLSAEDSAHLFYAASFAATAIFEGLGAQATNIILKSGVSDDNNKLCLHILPRMQGDDLQGIMWQPKQPEYDLDQIASKIKDKTWKVEHAGKKTVKKDVVVKPEVVRMSVATKTENKPASAEDEIKNAIEGLK
jgi:histidine triad (HIT) family protein